MHSLYRQDTYHCYYQHPMFGMSFGVAVSFDSENGTASVLDIFRTDTEMKITNTLTNTQYNRCLERFVNDILKPANTEGNIEYEYSADSPATPGENP